MVRLHTQHYFNSFKFVEVYFILQAVVILVYLWDLEKVCTGLLLDELLYSCQWDSVGWWRYWVLLYPCWFSNCFINCCERVLMFPTLILDLSISLFISVCLASHLMWSFCFAHALLELILILGGLTLSSLCYSPLFPW